LTTITVVILKVIIEHWLSLVINFKSSVANVVLITLPTLLILFLFLEVVFRFAIPAAEKPLAVFDLDNRLLRSHESRRTTGTYTMGKRGEIRAKWRINNFGWNSMIDYSTERSTRGLVSIIGGSHIRALRVDVGKDISSLLRLKIRPEYEVYSFGHDGAPLSQYLHVSRYANEYFKPDIFVFVIIHSDFHESIANIVYRPYFLQLGMAEGRIEEIQPTTRPLYQFLTYSATFRYLYSNLKLASLYFNLIQNPADFNANVNIKTLSSRRDSIRHGAEYLLTKIQAENSGKRTIFMMNAPVQDIYNDQVETSSVMWINKMVESLCARHGLECIDLTTAFSNDYKATAQRFDITMGRHWNEHAHFLASEILHDYLIATEQ
jgi:hypothetical protein